MSARRSRDRREELLSAGERVVRARGVERTTVEEVTSAAGVAKGTFYLYFGSKSDLLAALRGRFAQEVLAAAAAPATGEQAEGWFARAGHLLEVVADTHLENADLYRALFFGPAPAGISEPEEQWSDELVRLLTRFIENAAAAGAFSVRDPEATALLLFHGVHGLLHEALRRPEELDRARVLAAASELVARALAGTPTPAGTDRTR